jgi:hypothetical protein
MSVSTSVPKLTSSGRLPALALLILRVSRQFPKASFLTTGLWLRILPFCILGVRRGKSRCLTYSPENVVTSVIELRPGRALKL